MGHEMVITSNKRGGGEDNGNLIAAMQFGPGRSGEKTQPAVIDTKSEPYHRQFDKRKF